MFVSYIMKFSSLRFLRFGINKRIMFNLCVTIAFTKDFVQRRAGTQITRSKTPVADLLYYYNVSIQWILVRFDILLISNLRLERLYIRVLRFVVIGWHIFCLTSRLLLLSLYRDSMWDCTRVHVPIGRRFNLWQHQGFPSITICLVKKE